MVDSHGVGGEGAVTMVNMMVIEMVIISKPTVGKVSSYF